MSWVKINLLDIMKYEMDIVDQVKSAFRSKDLFDSCFSVHSTYTTRKSAAEKNCGTIYITSC